MASISIKNQHITKQLAVIAVVIATMSAIIFFSAHVSAAPVDVLQTCDAGSAVCKGTADSNTTVYGLLKNVINLLLTIIGIIAVITIVVAGIRYVTSGGDSAQTKNARDTILYALVGLVVAMLAFPLTNWVINQLNK